MDKWCASQWPLHARIKIVQSFLQTYIMYYLLLLHWKKTHLLAFDRLLKTFLWNKKHNHALVLSAWEYVCQPKTTGGLGILHAHSHLMARRAGFVMRVTTLHAPIWTRFFWTLVENGKVNFKGSWKLGAWNKFFSHAPLQTSSHTLNFLLWQFKLALSTLKWNGRQRYIGNSFAALSPYWSFLSNPPIAVSLGAAARYFNNKGIDSIAKCYNSKWDMLSFPTVRRIFTLGQSYKFKWLQIVSFLQVPSSTIY
ncbi:hypothetical protein KP509_31G069300 [Ceratopteris richardii]|uniref:Uncharacterized protein n=1 Tax=Ceratopteris richardii TaxID=49495 RepID=A0A8T2QZQ5_CERRI|nr:hypothetical protein KP509_31G069300 [Ceratopteris richardii]